MAAEAGFYIAMIETSTQRNMAPVDHTAHLALTARGLLSYLKCEFLERVHMTSEAVLTIQALYSGSAFKSGCL